MEQFPRVTTKQGKDGVDCTVFPSAYRSWYVLLQVVPGALVVKLN